MYVEGFTSLRWRVRLVRLLRRFCDLTTGGGVLTLWKVLESRLWRFEPPEADPDEHEPEARSKS